MTSSGGEWETYGPADGQREPQDPAPGPGPGGSRGGGGPVCTSCGAGPLQPGFVMDAGQNSHGYAQWVPGPLEQGIFGGAKLWGKVRFEIQAHRCPRCGHLELFTGNQTA